jgi:hypothetical protein
MEQSVSWAKSYMFPDIAYPFADCVVIPQGQFSRKDDDGNLITGTPDENAQTYSWFATGVMPLTIGFDWTTGFAKQVTLVSG